MRISKPFQRFVALWVLISFLGTSSYAQTILSLPAPGTMVTVSEGFMPPTLRGVTIHPDNPLSFDFILDMGDSQLKTQDLERESSKLIKYFLASLTIPENELWVNLSPYEKEKIISDQFGLTEMGRDLLAQDYILKQLTASLIYPENELGKKFWDRVYQKAYELYGTTQIPVNTFNKVWIVPERAVVYEQGNTAFVVDTHLKVMLEGDYLALSENFKRRNFTEDQLLDKEVKELDQMSSSIVKEVILPEIEREVNEGEHFSQLRQIYHSLILAVWYKQNLKESLLSKVYVNQGKVDGVDIEDKQSKEKIYERYLEAFQKGVYNYIKEDYDAHTESLIPRKYFSGGVQFSLEKVKDQAILTTVKKKEQLPLESRKQLLRHIERARQGRFNLIAATLAETTGDAQAFLRNHLARLKTEDSDPLSQESRLNQGLSEITTGLIGKQYEVTDVRVEKERLILTTKDKKTISLNVREKKWITQDELVARFKTAFTGNGNLKLITDIVKLLPEKIQVLTFENLEGDLLGLASRKLGLLALHQNLANNPTALFHEIGEFLGQSEGEAQAPLNLEFKITKTQAKTLGFLYVRDQKGRAMRKLAVEQPEVVDLFQKGPKNHHYLLRGMQRILLPQEDKQLSIEIKKALHEEELKKETRAVFKRIEEEATGNVSLQDKLTNDQAQIKEILDLLTLAYLVSQRAVERDSLKAIFMGILQSDSSEFRNSIYESLKNLGRSAILEELNPHLIRYDILARLISKGGEQSPLLINITRSFAQARILTGDNLDKFEFLMLNVIPSNSKRGEIYQSLLKLSELALEELDSYVILGILNLDFIRQILDELKQDTPKALKILIGLTQLGVITQEAKRDKLKTLKALFSGRDTERYRKQKIYDSLLHLTETFAEKGLNPQILDLEIIRADFLAISKNSDVAMDTFLALTEIGFIEPKTLKRISGLLSTLGMGDYNSKDNYDSLLKLVKAVKTEDLPSQLLDFDLLSTVISSSRLGSHRVLDMLLEMGRAVKTNGVNPVIVDLTLLKAVLNHSPWHSHDVYKEILSLAETVKSHNLPVGTLSKDTLMSLLEYTKINAGKGIQILKALAIGGAIKYGELDRVRGLFVIFTGQDSEFYNSTLQHIEESIRLQLDPVVLDFDLMKNIFMQKIAPIDSSFRALRELAEAVKTKGLDPSLLDVRLLGVVTKKERPGLAEMINGLKTLGEYVNKYHLADLKHNILDVELLKTIAEEADENIYKSLAMLARTVKEKHLDEIALDRELLIDIIRHSKGFATAKQLDLLSSIAKAGLLYPDNLERFKDFIRQINELRESFRDDFSQIFEAIAGLFDSAQKGEINEFIIDFDLILGILERSPKPISILNSLKEIGKAVKVKGVNLTVKGLEGPSAQEQEYNLATKLIQQSTHTATIHKSLDLLTELIESGFVQRDIKQAARFIALVNEDLFDVLIELLRSFRKKNVNTSVYDPDFISQVISMTKDANVYGIEALKELAEADMLIEGRKEEIMTFFQDITNIVKEEFRADAFQVLSHFIKSSVIKFGRFKEIIDFYNKINKLNNQPWPYQAILALDKVGRVRFENLKDLETLLLIIDQKTSSYDYLNSIISSTQYVKDNELATVILEPKLLTEILAKEISHPEFKKILDQLIELAKVIKRKDIPIQLAIHLDSFRYIFGNFAPNYSLEIFKWYTDFLKENSESLNSVLIEGIWDGMKLVKTIKEEQGGEGQKEVSQFLNWFSSHFVKDKELFPLHFSFKTFAEEGKFTIDRFSVENNLYLLPTEIRQKIKEKGFEEILKEVNPSNYLEEVYAASLYVALRRDVQVAIGLTFKEFLEILNGKANSPFSSLVTSLIQRKVFKMELELTPSQQEQIITLSIALHKAMLDLFHESATSGSVTFRELIRFNVSFSKFYLQQIGLENVIEYFILTAYNIYGRIIDTQEKKEKFTKAMIGLLYSDKFKLLLGQAQIESEGIRGKISEIIQNIVDYADYTDLKRLPQEEEIPLKVTIKAVIERSLQTDSAPLLIVDDDNSILVEEVLEELSQQKDTVMIRITMNAFSRRQELFGMYLPKKLLLERQVNALVETAPQSDIQAALKEILGLKEDEVDSYFKEWQNTLSLREDHFLRQAIATYLNNKEDWRQFMEWKNGVLVRLKEKAKKDKKKKYLINLDNISAAPDSVRLLLNPVLWERMVEVPEKGMLLELPSNLNFIMTMHKDTKIIDDAFMNRPLVQHVAPLSQTDYIRYLTKSVGLQKQVAEHLLGIFSEIKRQGFFEDPRLNFHDLIEIAKRATRVSLENDLKQEDVLFKEAFDYLFLRMRNEKDRDNLKKILFSDKEQGLYHPLKITVDRENGEINFDGVRLKASPAFLGHLKETPEADFIKLMNDHYGYIVTELEMSILSQLARSMKYGNRVVQLEGPSGEGKTEVGHVFSKLIALNLVERTINQETNLSAFRGIIRPTKAGRYELYEPVYLEHIEEGGNLFLLNEINTNQSGGLYYWLYPEITQRDHKTLSEFADISDESIVKRARIDQNNLWLFTVNPYGFLGRGITPPIIPSQVSIFYMAQNPDSLPEVIRGYFERNGLREVLSGDLFKEYVDKLTSIHKALRELKFTYRLRSPQDITPRELISVTTKFRNFMVEEKLTPKGAFQRAVEETYTYVWKNLEDIKLVRSLVNEINGHAGNTYQDRAFLNRVVVEATRPVMIFLTAANDLTQLEGSIQEKDPKAQLFHIPLSYFHRNRQFVGGLIPKGEKKVLSGRWKEVHQLTAQLEEGLGIIPELIKEARFNPERNIYGILYNYTHLNPQVAPLLNEFFQKGYLEGIEELITSRVSEELLRQLKSQPQTIWQQLRGDFAGSLPGEIEQLSDEEKLSFARWFYSKAPRNLRFIATGSSVEETSLSPAELNRFLAVNISAEMDLEWLENYLGNKISQNGLDAYESQISQVVIPAYQFYQQQMALYEYDHNRLGRSDVDAFIETLKEYPSLNPSLIKKLAFYTFGMGLRPKFRDEYQLKIKYQEEWGQQTNLFRYETRADGIYLIVDGIAMKTQLKEIPKKRFLAPTKNLIRQMASMLIGLKRGRILIIEGEPGGGKTSGSEDLAERLGLDFYKELMYEDINLGDFLGRLSKEGNEYVLTALKKDPQQRPLIRFLKAYTQGGLFLLDEGAIGFNSQEVISYLTELAQLKEFDLGLFHPGLKGQVLKRHPQFYLAMAQNPAKTTKARKPVPYRVDTLAHKTWSDNILDEEDAIRIMDYYLTSPEAISLDLKKKIVNIHIQFSRQHPRKEELSPRQIIMIARLLTRAIEENANLERAIFEGLMLGYLTAESQEEFTKLWSVVDQQMQGRLNRYLAEWKEPVKIEKEDNFIRLNGTKLTKSGTEGNVSERDFQIIENLPSQSKSLRALALGLSMNMPIALLQEDGADALDLVRKFAYKVNYELHTLWSHPQMTKMHVLENLLPKFKAQFDRYGIKEEEVTKEFIMGLGFLARHLMRHAEYEKLDLKQKTTQTQKILFFHLMDAIPEKQRVLLNDLLNTNKIELIDEKGEAAIYILPDWVHIMISSPVEHKFSSAFINRFLPIRISPISDLDEITTVIQNRYPLVKEDEVVWLRQVANTVYEFDRNGVFSLHYGFSPRDVFKLAALVQLEKQRDIEMGKLSDDPQNPKRVSLYQNPLYYVMKAFFLTYGLGIKESDYAIFENEIIKKKFLMPLGKGREPRIVNEVYEKIKARIKEDLSGLETEDYILRVDIGQMVEGKLETLPNGMNITRTKGGFIITTLSANVYQVRDDQLKDWVNLNPDSDEFSLKLEENQMIFKLKLINSIGGVFIPRDEVNQLLSLPEREVPTKEFIRYTKEIRYLDSSILRGWQRFKDYSNRMEAPRVLLLNGLTGTAKTTLIRNIARIWGVPLYILNSFEEIKVSDLTVGLKLREGKFQVGIKEFLARVGKINGTRFSIPSKTTSNRSILLIDEANANPEILYALAPLFRGEKKFTVEYVGESFAVEVDSEVMVVLTFNPVETYAGRGKFADEIVSFAEKLWAPDPLKYPEEVLVSILQEYHRRGITKTRQEIERQLPSLPLISQEGFKEVEPSMVEVKAAPHPLVESLDSVLGGPKEPEAEGEKPEVKIEEKKPKEKIQIKIEYDTTLIKEAAKQFKKEEGPLFFIENILNGFLSAIANGNSDEELRELVLKVSDLLGVDVGRVVKDIIEIYQKNLINEGELKDALLELRRVFIKRGLAVFMKIVVKDDTPFIVLTTEEIQRMKRLKADDLSKLGEDWVKYKRNLPRTLVVKGNKYKRPGVSGFFEGELAFAFEEVAQNEMITAKVSAISNVTFEEFVDWIALHELGHVMDKMRLKVRGFEVQEKKPWEKLIQDVNTSGIGVWLSQNIELNAMILPLIFSPKAKEFALYELVHMANTLRDVNDYYFQAARGILNALMKYLYEKGEIKELVVLEEDFTDEFDRRLNLIKSVIEKMTSKELNAMGAVIYQNPAKYFFEVKGGKYKSKILVMSGPDSIEEVSLGVDGIPDVDMQYAEKEGEVEITTPPSEGNKSKLIREPKWSEATEEGEEGPKGPPSGQKGEIEEAVKEEELTSGLKKQIETLKEINPNLISRFLENFAGTPETIKEYADTGDRIDVERAMIGDPEALFTEKTLERLAQLSIGLTIDVSGSVRGWLLNQFITMARYYSSLFHYASVKNKEVDFSISAVGDFFHSILKFIDARNREAVEKALDKISEIRDSGGINTLSVIKGLRNKYSQQKDKVYKMEIVLTDGGETSGVAFKELREKVIQLEKDLGIDVVFIGINTKEVSNYSKFIVLDKNPKAEDLIQLIIKLSMLKSREGMLPYGDLGELLGIVPKKKGEAPEAQLIPERQSPNPTLKRSDKAILTNQPPGGIDLNPANFQLEIKRDENGIPLPIPLQPIEQMKIDGFVPIIINITPIHNLPNIFGGLPNKDKPSDSSTLSYRQESEMELVGTTP